MVQKENNDYIMRQIEQLGIVLRRLLEKLNLGKSAAAEVVREASEAQGTLLGRQAAVARQVDAKTAVRIIGDPRKVKMWIGFLRIEATAHRLRGDGDQANSLETRANAIEQASN